MSDTDAGTPRHAVASALDSLRWAAEAVGGDPAAAPTASKLAMAVAFVEVIADELCSSSGYQPAVPAIPDTYTPTVIPVEELLCPLAENAPAGTNARLTGEFNELLSLLVNRSRRDDFRPRYREAVEKAEELLRCRGKDLGVAARLIEASTALHGFPAVADGLILINGLLATFREGLYPVVEDGDYEARANELVRLEELVVPHLRRRYGDPHEYRPGYADRDQAEREYALLTAMIDALDALDRFTHERFDDQAPTLGELRRSLATYHKRAREGYLTLRERDDAVKAAEAARRQHAVEAVLDEHAARRSERERCREQHEQRLSPPRTTAEPRSVEEACSWLENCARYLVQTCPADPLGYLVNRSYRWFSTLYTGAKDCRAPEKRMEIDGLVAAGKWSDVLAAAESAFMSGAHRWLDLQRLGSEAVERLGPEYAAVGECITDATMAFVRANDGSVDAQLSDLTPAADPETRQWVARRLRSRSASTGERPTETDGDLFTREASRARDMANEGDVGGAIDTLSRHVRNAEAGRDRFLWRLQIAELCVELDLARIAIPTIEELVATIASEGLSDWEDGELLCRVYRAGHQGYLKRYGPQKAPVDKVDFFHDRICLYDPGFFIPKKR